MSIAAREEERERREEGGRWKEKNREKGRMERSDTHLLHTNCSHITQPTYVPLW